METGSSPRAITTLIAIAAALTLICTAHADPHVVYEKCDPRGMIPQGSSFWSHLGYLLKLLGDKTPETPTYTFKTSVGGGDNPAYGEAYCPPFTSPSLCQTCLRRLSSDIWRICNSALGAWVAYQNCWIHYEDHYFY